MKLVRSEMNSLLSNLTFQGDQLTQTFLAWTFAYMQTLFTAKSRACQRGFKLFVKMKYEAEAERESYEQKLWEFGRHL